MHPTLSKLGPFTLYSYGAMFVIAFLSTSWLAARAAREWPPERVAISAEQLADFSVAVLLGGLIGARLMYVLLEWNFYQRAPQ